MYRAGKSFFASSLVQNVALLELQSGAQVKERLRHLTELRMS